MELIGEPLINIFSFKSVSEINIFKLQEMLKDKGWFIQPQLGYGDMDACCHMSVNYGNVERADDFILDFSNLVENNFEELCQKTENDTLNELPIKLRDNTLKTNMIYGE